jgi:hypothetical protein
MNQLTILILKAINGAIVIVTHDNNLMSSIFKKIKHVNKSNRSYMCKIYKSGLDIDYSHLKNMFLDVYNEVDKMVECPVCYTDLTKDCLFVSNCGHLLCKTCKSKLTSCPICRVQYRQTDALTSV